MRELAEWESFYVIVGSAGGALIGLQFVVMTLIAERPPLRAAEGSAAFATPTIVHFGVVLFLSALLSVPWHAVLPPAVLWGLLGVSGVCYGGVVARRMRTLGAAGYQPVFEDWLFFLVVPWVAYAILAAAAFAAPSRPREALFGVGAAALMLLFTGIHNAWDSVAWHVLVNRGDADTGHGGNEPPTRRKPQ